MPASETAVSDQVDAAPEQRHDVGAGWATIARFAPTAIVHFVLVTIAVRRYLSPTNADALLPSLMSTQRWTVFYWGQDRLANVVPLLTMPVRDPIWNFEVQTMVIAGAFFGTIAAFVSFHARARDRRLGSFEQAVTTLVAALVVMVPFHTGTGYRFVIEQLYFVSVLAWIGAVWLWTSRRYPLACVPLVVAVFVNPSLLAASPLIWLLDADAASRVRRSAAFVGASVTAFLLTDVVGALVDTGPDYDYPYDEFRWSRLEQGAREVAGNVAGSVRDHLATLVVIASVAIVAAAARKLSRRIVAVYLIVPMFAALWFVAFSTNGWVEQNLYEYRYFYPLYATYMLYVAAAATELTLACRRFHRVRTSDGKVRDTSPRHALIGLAGATIAFVMMVTLVHRVDVPALDQAEVYVDAAEDFDAELIAGDYWSVWPAVVAGRGAGLDVVGVSLRSDPVEHDIRDIVDRTGDSGLNLVCAGVGSDDCARRLGDWSGRCGTSTSSCRSGPRDSGGPGRLKAQASDVARR
ncbi:MAG: hypothetical protein R2697_08000 [Ilumatobacteraceae bacterium]